ncbi:MAG: beta-ketoacyl-ACP synthase 3 [Nanoarchaeota archaeon]|nr:beta-ketoacyl-ACP synthase 3 [Nanoarchaeota archaeon]
MDNVRIAGTGSYLPKNIVSNEKLEKIVKNYDYSKSNGFSEWVIKVTGIERRYYADENETTEEMGAEASEKALKDANLKASDIDLIILNTFTPGKLIPNSAIEVGHLIGNNKIPAITINQACSGFVYAVESAYHYIRSGEYNNILVVASEKLSSITDYSDPKTAVLFGDGAGAIVLQRSDKKGILGMPYIGGKYSPEHIKVKNTGVDVKDILTKAEKEYVKKEYIKMGGGPQVLRQAVNAMVESAKIALRRSNLEIKGIDWLCPHQANKRIIDLTAEHLNMPIEKTLITIEEDGNVSGASNIITLDKSIKQGKVKRGDKILITAVGGGYTMGAFVFEY